MNYELSGGLMRSSSMALWVSLVVLGSVVSVGVGAIGWSPNHAPEVTVTPNFPGPALSHSEPTPDTPRSAACTDCVLENISIANTSTAVAYDSSNNNIYVAEDNGAALQAISGASNTVTATIPVGIHLQDHPWAIALDTVTNDLYVPNDNANNVTVVDASTGKTVASVVAKPTPISAVFDSSNGYIYVGDDGLTTAWITVINGATQTLVTNIDLGPNTGEFPLGLAIDTSNGDLYVGNAQGNNITVVSLSTDKVTGSIAVGDYPGSVALDTSNNLLYAADTSGQNVSVVDTTTNTPIKSIAINTSTELVGPSAVAYDAATGCVYAPSGGGDWVSIINTLTNANIGTIAIQGAPNAVAVDTTNGDLYVSYTNPSLTASYVAVPAVANCPSGSVLSSVSVAPLLGEILLAGGTQSETATPTCSPSPCPGAVSYSWSINNHSLAHLSSASSNPTNVVADATSGGLTVYVNASLNGFTVSSQSSVLLVIVGGSGHGTNSSPPGFLDLPGSDGIILLGVVAIVAVAVVVAIYSMGKGKRPPAMGTPPPPPPPPP